MGSGCRSYRCSDEQAIREELWRELLARGFAVNGASPNNTMTINEAFLDAIEVAALFDTMVARRENVSRSGGVVGLDVAKKSYDDVVLVIDAMKAVIGRMSLS
jgi:hypothetical protein